MTATYPNNAILIPEKPNPIAFRGIARFKPDNTNGNPSRNVMSDVKKSRRYPATRLRPYATATNSAYPIRFPIRCDGVR